jgi:DNA polymerase-3 subunit delta'
VNAVAPAADLFWLAPQIETLRQARARGRFPPALLIHDAPGGGGALLGLRAAQAALCTSAQVPCGVCRECRRVEAGEHPDFIRVGVLEDAKRIGVDQIRELSERLVLSSHGQGATVALIEPAEAMNANAANALLKTLEEPRPGVTLILVTDAPSRLPATVRSRCQRLRVKLPARAATLAWLAAERGPGRWDIVLEVLGNAPLRALSAEPAKLERLRLETFLALDEAVAGSLDIPGTAERWVREDLELRLACLENWVTRRTYAEIGVHGDFTELRNTPYLPAAGSALNIRSLLRITDALHEFGRLMSGSVNRALNLEQLLWQLPRAGGA